MSAQGAVVGAKLTQSPLPAAAKAINADEHACEAPAAALAGSSTPRPANGTAHSGTGKANKHVPSESTSSQSRRPVGSATPPPQAGSLGRPSTPSREIGRAQSPFGPPSAEQRRPNTRGSRLSGFFSSLKPRPQTMPPTPVVPPPPPPAPKLQEKIPDPTPPSLAAPTLRDLGLTLNVLTPPLYPSHFATPPTSGTFMQPHFLLLCHTQGLDVLPLLGPPAPLAYALVRRVAFKSVVVMEERGVLVAIAGRRDGVRVYALEEVRRAIEWRIEVEVQREAEKSRREESRNRPSPSPATAPATKLANMQPRPPTTAKAPKLAQPSSTAVTLNRTPPPNYSSLAVPTISINRQPSAGRAASTLADPSRPSRDRGMSMSSMVTRRMLVGNSNFDGAQEEKPEWLESQGSGDEEALVAAGPSGSAALEARTSSMPATSQPMVPNATGDLPDVMEDGDISDGEAEINNRGSTETIHSPTSTAASISTRPDGATLPPSLRRPRPPSLLLRPPAMGLQNARSGDVTPPASPVPTVYSLQRSLSQTPNTPSPRQNERITFAQALMESRLPTAHPTNAATLRTASHAVYDPNVNHDDAEDEFDDTPCPPLTSTPSPVPPLDSPRRASSATLNSNLEQRSRRRWSLVGGLNGSSLQRTATRNPAPPQPASQDVSGASPSPTLRRGSRTAPVQRTNPNGNPTVHRSPSMPGAPASRPGAGDRLSRIASNPAPLSYSSPSMSNAPSSRTASASRRFLPKFFGAFRSSNHDRQRQKDASSDSDTDRPSASLLQGAPGQPVHAPPPKMEYVKLPGTQKALMIKAVETTKKSFLAILCGDSGEKVELFAGTYRTALGLSRTFILPDSPRSLELQLQGDDLVELFLMFNQNVFGLEPATVRVREVRIGRAERRARRRAAQRENEILGGEGTGEGREGMTLDSDGNTQVIATVVTVGDDAERSTASMSPSPRPTQPPLRLRRQSANGVMESATATAISPMPPAAAPATAAHLPRQKSPDDKGQSLPYTTFQQLSFAPNFPLAAIADEYVIPPTYLDFIDYQKQHETNLDISDIPITNGAPAGTSQTANASSAPRSPPGLPRPPPRWVYRDPKGILRGPWEAEVMQNWLRDGYLPPSLPLRRENETEFIILKDLIEAHPDAEAIFLIEASAPPSVSSSRPESPAPSVPANSGPSPWIPVPNVLLPPTSLLQQPRYFGPPALFFTTRGGHSTTIVDARGRSVLKGRVMWSHDGLDESEAYGHVLGHVKRIEAFDTRDERAVVVALRQGGLEAVDMSDALLQPGDHSRPLLPLFMSPATSTGRRKNYIWHLGSAVEEATTPSAPLSIGTQRGTALGRKTAPQRRANVMRNHSKDPDDNVPLSTDEDILFLGRNHDRVYMCERNADTFRILRLAPLE